MEIKKLTDLPIGELGEENYVVADVDGTVKRIPTEDIGGGGLVEGYFNGTDFYEDEYFEVLITPEKGKIYVDISASTGKSYRWSGSQYIAIAAISSDDPHVVIFVTPVAHEVVDPVTKLTCFSIYRFPGMDPYASPYDNDVREACAQYIFAHALGYNNSELDSSIAILRIGDESGMDETFNVVYIYMEDGGGKFVLEMSDGAKVTIDRSNTVQIDDKDYCTWDFIPAPTPVESELVVNVVLTSSPDVMPGVSVIDSCDKTFAEVASAVAAGRNCYAVLTFPSTSSGGGAHTSICQMSYHKNITDTETGQIRFIGAHVVSDAATMSYRFRVEELTMRSDFTSISERDLAFATT